MKWHGFAWVSLFAALFASAAYAAGPIPWPRVAAYGNATSWGYPLCCTSSSGSAGGPINQGTVNLFGRYAVVALPATPFCEPGGRSDILTALRVRNPSIAILAYVMGNTIWEVDTSGTTYYARYKRLIDRADGYIYTQSGGKNPSYGAYLVNLAKRDAAGNYSLSDDLVDLWFEFMKAPTWDGLFIDAWNNTVSWMSDPRDPIDYVRAGYPTLDSLDSATGEAVRRMAGRLRWRYGNGFMIYGNGIAAAALLPANGLMRERFPAQQGGSWWTNMFWEPGGFLYEQWTQQKPRMSWIFSAPSPNDDSNPYIAPNPQIARYGLGTAMLADGIHVFEPGDLRLSAGWWQWFQDEWSVNASTGASADSLIFRSWLGAPRSSWKQMISLPAGLDAITNGNFELNLNGWTQTIPTTGRIHFEAMPTPLENAGTCQAKQLVDIAPGKRVMLHARWSGTGTGEDSVRAITGQWARFVRSVTPGTYSIKVWTSDSGGAGCDTTIRQTVSLPTIMRDPTQYARGVASMRVTVPQVRNVGYDLAVSNASVMNCLAQNWYSITFWAKASKARSIWVALGVPGGAFAGDRRIPITTSWQRYQVSFLPSVAVDNAKVNFWFGEHAGTVWIDDVHLQAGVKNLYVREFQAGRVLVNPYSGGNAPSSITFSLGANFRRILGVRDLAANPGGTVSSITVPRDDARFLLKP